MRAKVAYERGELDAAATHARQAAAQLRQGHVTLGQETLYGLQSRIEQARGKVGAANAALERAAQIARGNDVPRLLSLNAAIQARVHLAQGGLRAAARWADEYAQQAPTEHLREFEDLTLVRVRLARGQPEAALDLLERLLPSAQEAGRCGPAIEALALRALGLHATGRPKEAASCLSLALGKAHPEGYVRPFSECGEPMRELLLHIAERSDADEVTRYAAQLLAAFAPPRPKASTANILPSSPLIEPLTARERDVLGLLAQGLTNAEIGRQLVISLPTVKSHTRNLYGKLGVHNRRSAVVRAQELGLLNDSYC
jgi:LuxR family maltose regulon positive regulatory protein